MLVTHSRAAAAVADRVLTLTADGLREARCRQRDEHATARVTRVARAGRRARPQPRAACAVGAARSRSASRSASRSRSINEAAIGEFTGAMATLSGSADLEVRGPRDGFDETLFARSRAIPDVAVASPVVEVDARIEGRDDALRIFGVDAFRAAAVTPALVGGAADPLDLLRPGMRVRQSGRRRMARRATGRHADGAGGTARRAARRRGPRRSADAANATR